MADVEIFDYVDGEELERVIARHQDVQWTLETEAYGYAAIAREVLALHRVTGDSYIEVEKGDIDRYVTLNDNRGQHAAAVIEFGRHKTGDTSKAVAPLRRAFRLGGME